MTLYQLKTIVYNCAGLARSPLLCYMSTSLVYTYFTCTHECTHTQTLTYTHIHTHTHTHTHIHTHMWVSYTACTHSPLSPPSSPVLPVGQDLLLCEALDSYQCVAVNPVEPVLVATSNTRLGSSLYDLRSKKMCVCVCVHVHVCVCVCMCVGRVLFVVCLSMLKACMYMF